MTTSSAIDLSSNALYASKHTSSSFPKIISKSRKPKSPSQRRTRYPCSLSAAPKQAVIVVLPTPPLPEIRPIISPIVYPSYSFTLGLISCVSFLLVVVFASLAFVSVDFELLVGTLK